MEVAKKTLAALNSSYLVADIQKFFGVEIHLEETNASLHNFRHSDEQIAKCHSEKESEEMKRRKLLREVTDSNSKYVVQNMFWYYLFYFSTCLGDEIFYASVIPFWFWNIDGAVGRRIVAIWALSMYIGQSIKDVVQMPRPRCPPAARLISKQVEEYGMPSTHALVSVMVPAAVLFYTSNRYEYRAWIGLIIAVVWCMLISISRLYLGMHSVLDVLAGITLAGIMLPILLPFIDWLDPFLLTHPSAPIVVLVTSITLLILAPDSVAVLTKEDTTVIISSAAGVHLGMWLSYATGQIHGPPLAPPHTILWPSEWQLFLMMLRTMAGLVIVFVTRHFGKRWSIQLMKNIVQWYRKQNLNVDNDQVVRLGYKFITYGAIGFNTCFLIPVLFKMAGIERTNFHTEV